MSNPYIQKLENALAPIGFGYSCNLDSYHREYVEGYFTIGEDPIRLKYFYNHDFMELSIYFEDKVILDINTGKILVDNSRFPREAIEYVQRVLIAPQSVRFVLGYLD